MKKNWPSCENDALPDLSFSTGTNQKDDLLDQSGGGVKPQSLRNKSELHESRALDFLVEFHTTILDPSRFVVRFVQTCLLDPASVCDISRS